MRPRLHRAALALLLAWLLPGMAAAHALLVSARGEGGAIVGKVYYSDGAQAVGEYLQLVDLDAPAGTGPRSLTTDSDGSFRFDGVVEGRRYRVIAEGEEGHVTELDITYGEGARAKLNDPDAAAGEGGLPAWLVIGGVLLLSVIPALWLRFRKAAAPGPRTGP